MLKRMAIALCLLASPVVDAARAPVPVQVEQAPSKADVIKALSARRAHNLASFRAYRNGGVYPHNNVRRGPLNVWKDRDGHLCAAATMIDKDGQHDLVAATAKANNFIRLLDETEGPLMDWILTSGFTIEEIDRIQEPMMMDDRPEPDYRLADANLAKDYAKTDTWLVGHAKANLDVAASRLLENPGLARRLVDGTL
jgi:hypothetical protein